MKIEVIRKSEQADGQFNGGAVLEKRPVFYQQQKTFPYSNLFYWAHAWSDKGSTIGLHPHQGFEILSFVLQGEIEHYDTKNKSWKKLHTGDVQIIRSGNGISHAEKLLPGSAIFQIWFDPNLSKTLSKPASYNDYSSADFPVSQQSGITTRVFKGALSPMEMDTEGISIKELVVNEGDHSLSLDNDKVYSLFLISGSLALNELVLDPGDFVKVENAGDLNFNVNTSAKIFLIESPVKPSYETYIEAKG